jgi:hypothetical protein
VRLGGESRFDRIITSLGSVHQNLSRISSEWAVLISSAVISTGDTAIAAVYGKLFNAWNHAQFGQPNGNAGAGPNFGRISSTRPPRLIQVAVKIYW